MIINFQEILKELEYRVEHGIIDLTKEEQVTKLVEILRENGISDANEMAQKARVYFSYINEALPKMSAKPKNNPSNGAAAAGQKSPTAKPQSSDSLAAKEAHKLGLVSTGFGRWAKAKGEKTTHMTDQETGKLVPVGVADEPDTKRNAADTEKTGDKKDAGGSTGGKAPAPTPNIPSAEFKNDAEKRAAAEKDGEENKTAGIQFTSAEQREIWEGLNDGDLSVLDNTIEDLSYRRDNGIAGMGGAVASYGENELTNFANELNQKGGFEQYYKDNEKNIKPWRDEFLQPPIGANERKQKEKLVQETANALGLDRNKDFQKIASYIATRNHYGDFEYNRLKNEKAKVWINGAAKGFGKNREALKAWTDAQFDGAIATNILVKTNSNIDTSKPFKVLQSEPKEHDQAVLQHLKTQLKYAKGADKQHYEHEIDAFEHLGFHDTYAIGHDKKGRTTVFSISNKKGNYLEDMWNNSSPAAALNLIKNSFGPEVSNKVVDILQAGVIAATDSKKGTNMAFANARLDSGMIAMCELPDMEKYMDTMKGSAAFNKWLDENDIAPKKTGDWLKAAQDYTRQADGDVAYDKFGKIFTKIGENGKVEKYRKENPGIDYNSLSIQSAIKNKNNEKNLLEAIHTDVASSIAKADAELGFPKKNGKNGPHTQAYLTTIMKSMHFDLMVTNYDKNLGIVTGIRGTTSGDFRNALAVVSKFEGEIKTEEGRKLLNKHLVENCKLDPQSRAIIIKDGDKSYSIVEDTWRTAGTSQKVEKKIGEQMKYVLKREADNRRKKIHY
jgi:hypothetical protein